MKPKKKKSLILSIARGHEFSMVGSGRSGLMKVDKKEYKRKKERNQGKLMIKQALEDF
mgnify:CR=1 FL=1